MTTAAPLQKMECRSAKTLLSRKWDGATVAAAKLLSTSPPHDQSVVHAHLPVIVVQWHCNTSQLLLFNLVACERTCLRVISDRS